jgi:hypothetical protein
MSSASLMAVLLDPDLARHLVLALRRYRATSPTEGSPGRPA